MHCTTWHIPKGFLLNFHGHHNFHICVLNFVHLFHLKRKFKKCFLLFSAFSLISLSLSSFPLSPSIELSRSFLKFFSIGLSVQIYLKYYFFLFSCSASMGRDPGSSPGGVCFLWYVLWSPPGRLPREKKWDAFWMSSDQWRH